MRGERIIRDNKRPTDIKMKKSDNAAIIGCGIQARTVLIPSFCKQLDLGVRVTAVCDCDKTRRDAAAKQVDGLYADAGTPADVPCRAVADFREILADPSIAMVCVCTPDHWHGYMAVEAMKAGKDVYCEKPLAYSIAEIKAIIATQRKTGRVFQTGSMQRSWPVFRTACMVVRNGFVGTITHVDANYGRGGQKLGGPSHPVRFWDDPANAATEGAPNPDVDWDMWLGPAKWRPYSDQLAPRGVNTFYPMFWRFDDDLGSGYNGDWGAHHLDIAQWGIDMDKSGPYKIIRSDEPYSTDLFHGGRRQFGMKMLFRRPDGGDIELYHGPFGVWGTIFYGTDGVVAVNRGKIAVWTGTGPVTPDAATRAAIEDASFRPDCLVASSVGQDYGTDATDKKDDALENALAAIRTRFSLDTAPVQLYVSQDQIRNFVECHVSGRETISTAETGGRSGALCLLCNLSYVHDTGFDWDPAAMDFANGTGKGISLGRDRARNGWDVVAP